jgi:hypothetical protein
MKISKTLLESMWDRSIIICSRAFQISTESTLPDYIISQIQDKSIQFAEYMDPDIELETESLKYLKSLEYCNELLLLLKKVERLSIIHDKYKIVHKNQELQADIEEYKLDIEKIID